MATKLAAFIMATAVVIVDIDGEFVLTRIATERGEVSWRRPLIQDRIVRLLTASTTP